MTHIIKSVLAAAILAIGLSTMPASAATLPGSPAGQQSIAQKDGTETTEVGRRWGGHRWHGHRHHRHRNFGFSYGYRPYRYYNYGGYCRNVRRCWEDDWGYSHCRWVRRCY